MLDRSIVLGYYGYCGLQLPFGCSLVTLGSTSATTIRTYIKHNLSFMAGLIESGRNFQGTKRIRGKTSQRCNVKGVLPNAIINAARDLGRGWNVPSPGSKKQIKMPLQKHPQLRSPYFLQINVT